MSLKYYRDENIRHHHALRSPLSRSGVKETTLDLCRHFGVPEIEVGYTDEHVKHRRRTRKVKSWYSPGYGEIVYHPSMFNVLTVAHEFAHAWHDKLFKDKIAAWNTKRNEFERIHGDNRHFSVPYPKPARSHGPEHAVLVDRAVAYLKSRGLMPPLTTPVAPAITAPAAPPPPQSAVRAAFDRFYAGLKPWQTCTKCGQTKGKKHFGIRVLSRDLNNVPTKMVRAPHCRGCGG